jgi:hypothetical protein
LKKCLHGGTPGVYKKHDGRSLDDQRDCTVYMGFIIQPGTGMWLHYDFRSIEPRDRNQVMPL